MIENKYVIMWDDKPTMYNFETEILYKTDAINEIMFFNTIYGAKRIVDKQPIDRNIWIAEIKFVIHAKH